MKTQTQIRKNNNIVFNTIDKVLKEKIVFNLLTEMEKNHEETYLHSLRVAVITAQISVKLGYKGQLLEKIVKGALLHDIGKLNVSNDILNKEEKLNRTEILQIQRHPAEGYERLYSYNMDHLILAIVLKHHIKMDGTGYPVLETNKVTHIEELRSTESEKEIVSIVTVVDIFDAITSERAYKKGETWNKALETMEKDVNKGKLNKKVVLTLSQMIKQNEVIIYG